MIKSNILRRAVILLVGATALCSCKENGVDDPSTSGEGTIYLSLSTDNALYDVDIQSKALTKADEPTLSADDFGISLENTKAEVLSTWASYADVPDEIQMVYGSYKLIAMYGDSSALPAFEAPVYGAEAKFTLTEDIPQLDVNLDCTPLATKIAFEFDSSFDYSYSKYELAAKTTGDSLHHTSSDFGRDGYYTPGTLRLMLLLWSQTDPDTCYEYYYDTEVTTAAAEYYHVTLNAVNTTGDLGITITTNDETIDFTISQSVPDFWLPKSDPEVVSHTFGEAMAVQTTRASMVEGEAILQTYSGVSSFVINTTSQEILDMGFPAEGVNVVGAADDTDRAAAVALLRSLGVSWSPKLDDAETASLLKSNTPLEVSFTELTMNLDTEDVHSFTVDMTDYEVGLQMETMAFSIEVLPLEFNVAAMSLPNVWATFAETSVTYTIDREGLTPVMQVSVDGGTKWTTTENTLTVTAEGEATVRAESLTPNTGYKFRIYIDDQAIGSVTDVLATEVDTQVVNGDMSDWTVTDVDSDWCGYQLAFYKPWTSTQHWDTGNERTTVYGGSGFGLRNQYTWACSVVYTSANARSGKSAEIRNISANYGSANVNSASANMDVNKTAGRLFIGDYDDGYNYGRTFGSRPLQMSFWYQYIPYGSDECKAYIKLWNETGSTTTQLGYGEFTLSTSTNMSSYVQQVVDVVYTNTSLRATHYTIEFTSSTASTPPVETNVTIDFPGSEDTSLKGHVGSKLRIDDIELHY